MKKKILIVNAVNGELMKEILESEHTNLEVSCRDYSKRPSVARGYEGYIIHLSETTPNELQDLRNEQQWSWIFGETGQGTKNIVPEVRSCLDGIEYVITKNTLDWIANKVIGGYREVKEEK